MGLEFEGKKRFRINPIEIAIFAVVTLIFVRSGYSLLYAKDGFDPVVLTATAEDPTSPADNRAPASVGTNGVAAVAVMPRSKSFSEVRIGCDPSQDAQPVSAHKVRLLGNLCTDAGTGTPEAAADLKNINVINTSAKVTATVFPDYTNRKFSTDYISLDPGKNVIYVEYQFKDGKSFGREYNIMKN